jgi:hypothetical protein
MEIVRKAFWEQEQKKGEIVMKTSRKCIALATVLIALMVLFSMPTYAQNPAGGLKPTFISPTPGLYVHGWPAFTVSYPKEWAVLPPPPGAFFRAGLARQDLPPSPILRINVFTNIFSLEDWAKGILPMYSQTATDVKAISDRPSRLKDGTPAREVELEFLPKGGSKMNHFILMTKKGLAWISVTVGNDKGMIEDDLKNIAYSLAFQPGREEPVKVPPDVRAFLDKHSSDIVSGDIERIMSNFSDQFLQYGMKKAFFEQYFRNDPSSATKRGVISSETTVTVFEPQGDNKAYIDGFGTSKRKDDANDIKAPMAYQQIIKENGQWKWYGNQK